MKLPDAYTIKQYLSSLTAIFVVAVLAGAIMLAVALTSYYSKEGVLQRANEQAAEEFVRVVETDWPNNRANVFFALHHMRSTYINTGENNSVKFQKMERLQDWFLRSQTAGEEMLFLTEVRKDGKVIASPVWFSDLSRVSLSILLTMIVTALIHFKCLERLRETDPRLRSLGT